MTGSTEIGPMVAVRQFVEGFNNDDVDLPQAACADETSIIDDFPPHEWTGRGATTRWYREMAGMATGYGMSDWSVTLAEPRHVAVSDWQAYVVVPVDVRWMQDGTPVAEDGLHDDGAPRGGRRVAHLGAGLDLELAVRPGRERRESTMGSTAPVRFETDVKPLFRDVTGAR